MKTNKRNNEYLDRLMLLIMVDSTDESVECSKDLKSDDRMMNAFCNVLTIIHNAENQQMYELALDQMNKFDNEFIPETDLDSYLQMEASKSMSLSRKLFEAMVNKGNQLETIKFN